MHVRIRNFFSAAAFLAATLSLAAAQAPAAPPAYDVLIRNGKIADGSGNPWRMADVGIKSDRIVFIGKAAPDVTAARTIEAAGKIVSPGFIDMLGQSELNLLVDNSAFSKLSQGITTEITGEGESAAPQNAALVKDYEDWAKHFGVKIDWTTFDEYFRRIEAQGTAINIGSYVGATQVRKFAMGSSDRAPTKEELDTMVEAVGDAMGDGAMGLSSALMYAPAIYAKTDELIALAKEAAKAGGIYATHLRSEAAAEPEALDEAFRIAREAHIPLEIFHLKVAGRENWGSMAAVIARIDAARAAGVDVAADQYPYTVSATSLAASIPQRFHDGGVEALLKRLRDPEQRAAIRKALTPSAAPGGTGAVQSMWLDVGGAAGVRVISVLAPELKQYEGKSVAEIAAMQKKDPIDALLDLLIADRLNTGAVYSSMNEEDVRLAMRQPWVSIDTDYGAVNVAGKLSESKSHPRAYGTFPRILGRYVRDEKLLTLEDAIRKMTFLPAQRLKLENRGLIRTGYFADLTIFDPATILDRATFDDPNRASEGISFVLVNGKLAFENGAVTAERAGRPLRGPGYSARAIAPEGLRPVGKIQGFLSGEDGYPMTRAKVTLVDAAGKTVAEAGSQFAKGGLFEMPLKSPCNNCVLRVEKEGFETQTKSVEFNGSNSLYMSFALKALAKSNPPN